MVIQDLEISQGLVTAPAVLVEELDQGYPHPASLFVALYETEAALVPAVFPS